MTIQQENEAIANAATNFPPTFALRAWPNRTFRINTRQAYVHQGVIIFVIDIQTMDDGWQNFTTCNPEELAKEVVS